MARKSLLAVAAAAAISAGFAIPAQAVGPQPAETTPVTIGAQAFIVTYQEGYTAPERVQVQRTQAETEGATVMSSTDAANNTQVVTLDRELDAVSAAEFMDKMKAQPGVADIEIDRILKHTGIPNDTYYPKQWDMKAAPGMNVEPARDLATGSGVKVGVIDTGISPHSDLRANVLPGYDFISNPSTARDGNGRDDNPNDEGDWVEANDPNCGDGRFYASSFHGSHVTGTIAAVTNNSNGIASVAPDAKVVPARVLGRCGGSTSDILAAMRWEAGLSVPGVPTNPNPVKVINMSLGGQGLCSSQQQATINEITAKGVTIVIAAGNSSMDARNFNPANCQGVVTVAASGPSGNMAYYSNFGPRIDITAPGGDMRENRDTGGILSTVNAGQRTPTVEGYTYMQGTSMAAPHVAGLAALLYSAKPGITPAQVKDTLIKASTPISSCTAGCGAGLVDATKAVKIAKGLPTDGGGDPGDPVGTNVIKNGDFEQGPNVGWTGDTWTINTDPAFPTHSGAYKLWLLGYGQTTTEQVSQTVTVPANGKLSFYLGIGTNETSTYSAYDTMKVQVVSSYGTATTVATYSNRDAQPDYMLKTLDLSNWAGKQVSIRFTASEDSSNATSFVIDDVKLASA